MSVKSSNYDENLFKQELKVFSEALKENDFRTITITSNRIMTNAWFFDQKFYGITGFFMRQMALDLITASNIGDTAVNSIKSQTERFIDDVLGQVSAQKFNFSELWSYFLISFEKNRKEFLPPGEKSIYSTEYEYTKNVFSKMLEVLNQEKPKLSYLSNNLVKGILNELNRTSRTYGIQQTELMILSILIMIDRIDEYVGLTTIGKKDFEDRIQDEVIPLIDKLSELSKNPNEDTLTSFLWNLICEWRLYYVRFMEVRPQIRQRQKPKIEEEIKEDMVDEFVEGIEGELVKK